MQFVLEAEELPRNIRYGSQATLVVYAGGVRLADLIGSGWIRAVSVLTYLSRPRGGRGACDSSGGLPGGRAGDRVQPGNAAALSGSAVRGPAADRRTPRPPVLQLAQVLVLILAVAVGLGWIFGSLAHSPASVWLILLAIVTLCLARLSRAPRDIPATLALSVASLVTVLLQVSPDLRAILPWLMGRGFVLGALTAWVAFALLPGRPVPVASPPPWPPQVQTKA